MHTRERLGRDAVLSEVMQDRRAAARGAQHADVTDVRAQRVREHRQVVLVVMRDEHERGGWHQRVVANELGRDADLELVDVGKAFPGREPRSAVHDHGAVAEDPRQRGERHGDVTGADHEQQGRRRDDFHEAAHRFEEQRP